MYVAAYLKQYYKASSLFWVDVARDSGYWEVQIDDITMDDHPQELCANCFVAVDTGTSELAGPSEVVDKLAENLNVLVDCSNFDKLPKLGFVIGGHISKPVQQAGSLKTSLATNHV